jgi:hypothetical protein
MKQNGFPEDIIWHRIAEDFLVFSSRSDTHGISFVRRRFFLSDLFCLTMIKGGVNRARVYSRRAKYIASVLGISLVWMLVLCRRPIF